MPRKIRDLLFDLRSAGFIQVPGGKGSDRKFVHPMYRGFVLISGPEGGDCQHYQEKHVRRALRQIEE